MTVKNIFLIIVCIITLGCINNTENTKISEDKEHIKPEVYLTDMHIEEYILSGKAVNDDFKLKISYTGNPDWIKPVPVIYMLDSYWHTMNFKYIHYFSKQGLIPHVLVVGIGYPQGYNFGEIRFRDLFNNPESFYNLLTNEIIPYVESEFNCIPDARILQGTSLGGHFALYAFFTSALKGLNTFTSYIAVSPVHDEFTGTDLLALEEKTAAFTDEIEADLFICYGGLEDGFRMKYPNSKLIATLLERNYSGLYFVHNEYAMKDHYSVSRPGCMDGILDFLSYPSDKFEDISYSSMYFDFSTETEIYDWSYALMHEETAGRNIYHKADKSADNDSTGSMGVSFDFSEGSIGSVTFIFDYFYDLSGKEFEYSLYIPEDLAELGYSLEFFTKSTKQFIKDTSEAFALNEDGWVTFKYQFPENTAGNLAEVKEMGISIEKTVSVWKGDILIDNISW